jgi:hypothetical protein
MVSSIDGAGNTGPRRITDSKPTRSKESEGASRVEKRDARDESGRTGDLKDLIGRIKGADSVRKNRVHEVKKLMRNGELLSPEAIRNAAERLLAEEL